MYTFMTNVKKSKMIERDNFKKQIKKIIFNFLRCVTAYIFL